MWSRIHCVFPAHILTVFIVTSPLFLINLILSALPIDRDQFAPLLVCFGCLLTNSCYFHSATNFLNFNSALRCVGSPAINAFSHFATSNKHKVFNFIVQPQPMELSTSLQMTKLASSQLVTPAHIIIIQQHKMILWLIIGHNNHFGYSYLPGNAVNFRNLHPS
jgi:hypothetical protein